MSRFYQTLFTLSNFILTFRKSILKAVIFQALTGENIFKTGLSSRAHASPPAPMYAPHKVDKCFHINGEPYHGGQRSSAAAQRSSAAAQLSAARNDFAKSLLTRRAQRAQRAQRKQKSPLKAGSSALSTQLALWPVLSSGVVIRSLGDSQRTLHHSKVFHRAK